MGYKRKKNLLFLKKKKQKDFSPAPLERQVSAERAVPQALPSR
jgi:hypothetical protein